MPLNIAILNWRDRTHSDSGGAELYIHEIAKGLVRAGNTVSLICGQDNSQPKHEVIRGIEIWRKGNKVSVYFWTWLKFISLSRKRRIDLVIESVNGVPYLSPLYAERTVCLVHHVHRDFFKKFYRRPFSRLLIFLESFLFSPIYRRAKFVAVSESTRQDLLKGGIKTAKISVITAGADHGPFRPGKKNPLPLVAYIGRLSKVKSVDVLITAFAAVRKGERKAELVIAGEGKERKYLERLARRSKIEAVHFTGRLSEKEKISLMQRAWLIVQPSFAEGWSITVTEANACGTPTVAANSPGLRDSVRHSLTGILVRYGDARAFERAIKVIISCPHLRARQSLNAISYSKQLKWELTCQKLISQLN
ncbi:MAG: glycosyltransferase family 4 protein [Candidatus Taylorbacteria bacterium]|nr:glycosyltransferase family 4 protein [Candidatus Taylorbacteria bacterium]